MKITTKQQFIDLYMQGVLGNKLKTWTDVNKAYNEVKELVGFRELSVGAGSFEVCNKNDILHVAIKWNKLGRKFYLNETDYNEDARTIQGEICYLYDGWHGFIGLCNGLRMRDMFAAGLAKPYRGLAVKAILNYYMDDNSLYDIEQLLELYPEATIEFTCYSTTIGILPNRNTIIWEVRNY